MKIDIFEGKIANGEESSKNTNRDKIKFFQGFSIDNLWFSEGFLKFLLTKSPTQIGHDRQGDQKPPFSTKNHSFTKAIR